MTPLCDALCGLLPRYCAQDIEEAIPKVFQAGETEMPLRTIANRIEDHLDATLKQPNGFTKRQNVEHARLCKQLCDKAIRRNYAEVEAFAWFAGPEEALDLLAEQRETIRTQQRVIQDLIDYIGGLPLPK